MPRLGAGRDENRFAGQGLRLSVRGGHDNLFDCAVRRRLDLGLADDVINLFRFEEIFDSARHLIGHAATALHHFREIELDLSLEGQTVSVQVPDERFHLGAFQQGLGRNTTPVEARAPGPFHFHADDFLAQLRRADGADIAGRTAADNHEIIFHRGERLAPDAGSLNTRLIRD